MAFLVLKSKSVSVKEIDFCHKVIYLDQHFYEIIFKNCSSNSLLGKISRLKYKSDSLLIRNEQLDSLMYEVKSLSRNGIQHNQVEDLVGEIETTKHEKSHLWFSADMYPELKESDS